MHEFQFVLEMEKNNQIQVLCLNVEYLLFPPSAYLD